VRQKIKEERLTTDILVVGGGIAGLFAAIKARLQGYDVILSDKSFVGRCGGTHYAEGDIQFFRLSRGHVMKDWLDKNSRDTEYINNRDWNEIILSESEDRYNDLVDWGIEFYKVDGEIVVEGPHLVNNIPKMYEIICMRNREYAPTLRSKALKEGVRVYDRMMTCELLKQDGKIVGAMGLHTTSGKLYTIKAKATILATGASTAYKVRVMNTDYWTGDGICMAYRAGAEISGMEFRQSTGGYHARRLSGAQTALPGRRTGGPALGYSSQISSSDFAERLGMAPGDRH
jgi:succinate dehydrogenase/fumarate reductase flavoprotein subunit